MEATSQKIRRTAGEIFSQLLNVPVLSGLLITYFFVRLPGSGPVKLIGFLYALLFISIIPLGSLFFYIPVKNEEHERTLHRQRVASFVFMIVSYPIGWLVLSLIHAPAIFTALAEIYTFVTLGLIIINLLMRYKASGHAAGVSGPVASMIYLYGIMATPLLALIPLVTWARMAAKGHNFWQTVVGALLSGLISVAVLWSYGFSPFAGLIK